MGRGISYAGRRALSCYCAVTYSELSPLTAAVHECSSCAKLVPEARTTCPSELKVLHADGAGADSSTFTVKDLRRNAGKKTENWFILFSRN